MQTQMLMPKINICYVCKVPTATAICEYCWPRLLRLQNPIIREEDGFTIHSLFRWRPDEAFGLWWLLKSLKGRRTVEGWSILAGLFLQTVDIPEDGDLIPIPGPKRDHAFGFAAALAERAELQVVDEVLNRRPGRIQKRLGRGARQNMKFSSNLNGKYFRDVILVDDVVTTGATFRAAYLALGRPENCSAWALVDRRPCGGS